MVVGFESACFIYKFRNGSTVRRTVSTIYLASHVSISTPRRTDHFQLILIAKNPYRQDISITIAVKYIRYLHIHTCIHTHMYNRHTITKYQFFAYFLFSKNKTFAICFRGISSSRNETRFFKDYI